MMRSRNVRRLLLICAVLIVFGYALFEARGLLRGPVITIESPESGAVITEPLVRITGNALHINAIRMDDRPIFISEEGRINEPIALLPGYNEVTFKGTDRFGKTTRVDLVVLYEPKTEALPTLFPATTASSSASSSAETATDTPN